MEKLTISSKADNEFEFDITAQGLDVKKGRVMFCVKMDEKLTYQIECDHALGVHWKVKFPKGLFKSGVHDFIIAVAVDDFYFEPINGRLTVVDAESIKITQTTTTNTTKPKSTAVKKIQSKTKDRKAAATVKKVDIKPIIAKKTKTVKKKAEDTTPKLEAVQVEPIQSKAEKAAEIIHSLKEMPVKSSTKMLGNIGVSSGDTPKSRSPYSFFKTDHAYEKLEDGGEKDKKAREIIRQLNDE